MIIIIENDIIENKKTKLKFIKGSKFEMKEYLRCGEVSSLLKLKLNMVDLKEQTTKESKLILVAGDVGLIRSTLNTNGMVQISVKNPRLEILA